uniref:Uncharacterized protein n=1 Tax=Arundo donax TaxID=35708 RepID=A0A0A9HAH8_ARUDO
MVNFLCLGNLSLGCENLSPCDSVNQGYCL